MADSGTYDQGTITRRQKIAEQMLAESSKPQQIRHWAQGLAQLGNVGADAFALNRLDKQAKEGRAADTAALMGILDTGGQAPTAPQSAPISAPAPPSDAGGAIAGIESGGKYDALGPVTKTGDRAYGKYQVMGANIPEWTKAHAGREMTPQEFVASPEAQDAVFKGQFGQYANKYGNEGAARAWFAGEGGMNDPGRRDQLGTSVADYSKKFTDAAGPQAIARAMTPPVLDAGGPAKPDAQGVYGPDATMMPPAAPTGSAAVAQAMTGALSAGQPPAPAAAPLAAQNAPQGIPDQQRAAIARLMSATPGSPAYQLGLQLAGQALKPKDYGFQTLPDGTILRTDPHQGTAMPIYQGATKLVHQTLPDGTVLEIDPTGKIPPKPIYQAPSRPKFVPNVGPNRYGLPQPGFVDEIKGTARLPEIAGGAPAALPSGVLRGDTVGADANEGAGGKLLGDLPTGQAYLDTLDKPKADQVKALVEGRLNPPGSFALKTPYWQQMLQDAAQYEPGFDFTKWGQRNATAKDFASGKSAQNITSFNTAIGHLDTLDKQVDKLGNTDFPMFNTAANWLKTQGGNTEYQKARTAFETSRQAVTDELTRAFRGTGGNVHDIKGWEEKINAANSPAALHEATKSAIELLRSRIESVGDTYNRGMNTKTEPIKLLSPKAQEAIGRLSGEAGPEKKTETAPKVGEEKEFKQGVGVWNGTAWVPKGGPGG